MAEFAQTGGIFLPVQKDDATERRQVIAERFEWAAGHIALENLGMTAAVPLIVELMRQDELAARHS